MPSNVLVEIANLKIYFNNGRKNEIKAVDDVSFKINEGEVFCLVGESGSGKTTIGKTICRIYKPTEGKIYFEGVDIFNKLNKKTNKHITQNIQTIFQDPVSSLNQSKRIGDIIAEGYENNNSSSKKEKEEEIRKIMLKVGLNGKYVNCYPNQLSGGEKQRVGIARVLIVKPKMIIADECVSALDVSIQAQIINLLKEIQDETKCSYLFITHNLSIARYIADRIGILRNGKLVEVGSKDEIFNNPKNSYTKMLISQNNIGIYEN